MQSFGCLCSQGACARIQDVQGNLALHEAVAGEHLSIVQLLLNQHQALTVGFPMRTAPRYIVFFE
jgi:ankyrin repeat protein